MNIVGCIGFKSRTLFDYASEVKGRWNLVCQCATCGQFMHDFHTEWFLFSRQKWPRPVARARREWLAENDRFGSALSPGSCSDCGAPPASLVSICDLCGAIGSPRFIQERDGTGTRLHGYDRPNWQQMQPLTCPRCAGRATAFVRKVEKLNSERLSLQRLSKEARQAIKERKDHEKELC